ncbi:MAG TPA: YgiQ family radical SAM protein [Bacteroidales bacterium]|nr:YgiQ family radical SAM protein [Bacteroidales bacterium]
MTSFLRTDWLPTTKKEMEMRHWSEVDVVLFSGDAYIDHPSFGPAVVSRLLESLGLNVALVPQPDWRGDHRDFTKMGRPKLFFAISAGSMDSMVNHYTAGKRLRSDDAYTAGGLAGARPDYATTVYSNILKTLYPDVPIVIGGIEASLRRLTHYDYWSDRVKPSILIDSRADLLIYGMGEKPLTQLIEALRAGRPFSSITDIKQTVFVRNKTQEEPEHPEALYLHSHERCLKDKRAQAENFRHIEQESNKMQAKTLIQTYGDKEVVVNPPFPPLSSEELDRVYALPFTRLPHPKYKDKTIPAYEMIKHSITLHRGCFGGCSFCTISAHQGKFVSSRSQESVVEEVKKVVDMEDFKGYLSDLGGPSANMYRMQGNDLSICQTCKRPSCIFPSVCNNLNTNHQPLIDLYRAVDRIPGIKKSFIGSGIRYDLAMQDRSNAYLEEVIHHHVSGRLKVAPEHVSNTVLRHMRKPKFEQFEAFKQLFDQLEDKRLSTASKGGRQQLIPYFISSHPGSTELDMAELAAETKRLHFKLEQVQDFTPTPMTLATEAYYTGLDPYTLQPIYTAKSPEEKLDQRAYFFWYDPKNKERLKRKLQRLNRPDLIQKLFGNGYNGR